MPSAGRGLFLDLDGTLADSLGPLRAYYDEFLAGYGCRGTESEFEQLNGLPLSEVLLRMKRTHGLEPEVERLVQSYRDGLAARHQQAPARSGAAELLASARRRGLAVGVVSSAPRDLAEAWLERHGLAAHVAVVVGGDCVERGKPDPEPYQRALLATGCRASGSLAVEDSAPGARSAVAAGLRTFVLGPRASTDACWPAVEGFVSGLGVVREELGRD